LHLLKHIEGLSDEAVCQRWERDRTCNIFAAKNIFDTLFRRSVRGRRTFAAAWESKRKRCCRKRWQRRIALGR
jgi:hypothetical protein